MSLLDRLHLRRRPGMLLPPPRQPDPEIIAAAMNTTRVLTRVDGIIERRRRLNLELARAEDIIRSAGDARAGR